MKLLITGLFIILINITRTASAISPTPLPAVALTAANGETIMADQIGKEQNVLLVLVRRGSPGGEKLLAFLNGLKQPLPAARLVIIAGGADDRHLKTLSERYRNLSHASWCRDTDELLAKGMNLQATPVVLGVRRSSADWSVVGMLDEAKMEGIFRGWVTP